MGFLLTFSSVRHLYSCFLRSCNGISPLVPMEAVSLCCWCWSMQRWVCLWDSAFRSWGNGGNREVFLLLGDQSEWPNHLQLPWSIGGVLVSTVLEVSFFVAFKPLKPMSSYFGGGRWRKDRWWCQLDKDLRSISRNMCQTLLKPHVSRCSF